MLSFNFPILLLSSLIPLLIGMIWYHPKVLGTLWMKEAGLQPDQIKSANMVLILGLSFLFSFFLSMTLQFMVIHQWHLGSIIQGDTSAEAMTWLETSLSNYGSNFRTFKHGSLHGFLVGAMFALPLVGINALFERRSGKYIFIHAGYWILSFTLMGGIICQFS